MSKIQAVLVPIYRCKNCDRRFADHGKKYTKEIDRGGCSFVPALIKEANFDETTFHDCEDQTSLKVKETRWGICDLVAYDYSHEELS